MKKIVPMVGYVLVEEIEENKLSSGIVVAGEKDKQSQIGKVIEITKVSGREIQPLLKLKYEFSSQDVFNMSVQNRIKVGDIIAYKKYSGHEIELEGKRYRLVSFSDIIGLIQ